MRFAPRTEFRDSARYLGPIYTLPVAQELCEVTAFHPRVCEAFSGGTVDTVYRITTERLFEELNQFVCQNRYRLPSSHLRQINRWWETVFTQHMLRLFDEQDIPRNNTELTFSRLGVYGIRIKQFARLIESIVEMLRPENLSRAAKLMQELLDTEVRRVYEKFAENTVSEEAIARLRRQKPIRALRSLANNCVALHDNLMEWAEQKHLSWPPRFLENLLSFQKFLDGIATAGPFRSLLHLALVFSKSEGISVRELLPKVQQHVVINLDDDEEEATNAGGAGCQFIIDRQGDLSDTDSTEKLTSAVERFNLFIDSLTVGLKATVGSPEGPPLHGLPWKLLRQFEKNLLQDLRCSEKTLLTLLANASDSDKDVARPVYLFPKSFVNETSVLADSAAAQTTSAIQEDTATDSAQAPVATDANKMDTINVQTVRTFVLRLTCLLERSLEAIVELAAREFKTTESTDLLNTVQCFLAESVVSSLEPPRLAYLFHPLDFSFLVPKQASGEAMTYGMLQSKFAQELVSQRSAVLSLLATCPPMLDPEQWTLWSYPGFLAQRWGELEEFMLSSSALEVCDKFNLIVLKLSSGCYLRLSASTTSQAIEKAFLAWQQQQQQDGTTKSPSPLRGLCDALVGSALSINRLSVEDAITALASRLRNVTASSGCN
uniref:Uncharacterized protein n=1 Tax=Schistocephalus solidus TaxID=70667 RepID=A0A0X3P036_SCHSO